MKLTDTFNSEESTAPVHPAPAVFDPKGFLFHPRVYRVHFKNGLSGEYHGEALAQNFPFDPHEVERVEPVEDPGERG